MKPEIQRSILAACGRYVRKMLGPVDERVKALESRVVEKGEPGKDGRDGKDASPELVRTVVEETLPGMLSKARAALTEQLEAAVKAIPTPRDGENGADGRDGAPGVDGVSPNPEEVAAAVIAKLSGDFERRFADLSLSWERQVRETAEKALDRIPAPKDGKDGADGRDGIGWDDMRVEHDGKRCVTLVWEKGETEHRAEIMIPCVIDAGYFSEGQVYEKGDGVTFGGSYWIAQGDTTSKPEIGNHDWRLAVKKGRDAKAREVAV